MKPIFILIILLSLLMEVICLESEVSKVVFESEVGADIAVVWNAFTTTEGLQSWMAPIVEIDLKVGGKIRSNYNSEGKIGDETTIENTILAFDPYRMISLKTSKYPSGFPFKDAAEKTWSVFYFEELPSGNTLIKIIGLGYGDDEESKQLKEFFDTGNRHSIENLKKYLE